MFPFTIRGKVLLGPRKDFHLSAASLEDRISRRLVDPSRAPTPRRESGPIRDNRKPLIEEVSRLLSIGFLSAVKVKKIQILTRRDCFVAEYKMDVIVTTLVCVVLIPLVLGTALFAKSTLSTATIIALLALLVVITWGLDTGMLVMLVRYEITQIASEIKTVMQRTDMFRVDTHHHHLDPEDLLATAYYYERNDLMQRSQAYLDHLTTWHPGTPEGELACQRLEELEGRHSRPQGMTTGNTSEKNENGSRRFLKRKPKKEMPMREISSKNRSTEGKPHEKNPEKGFRKILSLPRLLRLRKEDEDGAGRVQQSDPHKRRKFRGFFVRKSKEERRAAKQRKRLNRRTSKKSFQSAEQVDDRKWWQRIFRRKSKEDRRAIKQRKRLNRRTSRRSFRSTEQTDDRKWWQRFIQRLSKKERLARKREKRWIHGPPSPKTAKRKADGRTGRKRLTAPWLKTREKRLARQREERVSGKPLSSS
jgi:hypothetical protein